jgi:hypothetical protein
MSIRCKNEGERKWRKWLVPLGEYNSDYLDRLRSKQENGGTGIACPNCGQELLDHTERGVLMCNPPKMEVMCLECGFSGYRYV